MQLSLARYILCMMLIQRGRRYQMSNSMLLIRHRRRLFVSIVRLKKNFEEEKILRYTSFVACSYRIYVDKLSKWRNVLFYLQKINK